MRGAIVRGKEGDVDAAETAGGGIMVGGADFSSGVGSASAESTIKRKRKSKDSSVNAANQRDPSGPLPTGRDATLSSTVKPVNGVTAPPAMHLMLPNDSAYLPSSPSSRTRSRNQSQSPQPQLGEQQPRLLSRTQSTGAGPSSPMHTSSPRPIAEDKDRVLRRAAVPYSDVFPVREGRVGPQHFQKIKLLGRGGIGRVFLVLLRGTDKLYAMKVLTKEEMIQRNKVKRVMTEREILATANHPFIVTMYASFQTVDRLCFVMEYCEGGEFFRVLQRQPKKRLKEDAVRFYAAEVTLALEYLHHMGFIYRDLKPENILMRADGHIALTDFDLSKQAHAIGPRVLQREQSVLQKLRRSMSLKRPPSNLNDLEIVDVEPVLPYQTNSFVGTEEYISPEVVKGVGQSATVDWWTLGILIYEMLTGTTPFKGSYTDETFSNIVNHTLKWPEDVLVSSDCKHLVKRLLKRDSQRRLGAENGATDIKRHKWFKDFNFELIRNETPPIIPQIRNPSDVTKDSRLPQEEESQEAFDDANPNNVFQHFYIRRDSEVQRQY